MSTKVNVPQLRFKEFQEEWKKTFLKNILKKLIDCEHKTAPYVEYSKYLVVRTNNVKNGRLLYDEIKYTTQEGFAEWTKRKIPSYGDILFTREAPAGESCLVPENKTLCLGQRMVLLQPNLQKINASFLLWLLQSNRGKKSIKRFVIGTTVTRINIKDIYRIDCSIPSLVEQEIIASFLTSVDTKIEQLTSKTKLLQKYKKGVMQKIFSQVIRFKDDDKSDYPEWIVKKLKDFKSLNHGDGDWILSKDISSNGQYKIVQLGNIGLGTYVDKTLKTISANTFKELNGTPIKKGDLLINRMVDGNINCCIFHKDDDFITSVDVCWIRENEYFNNYFLMNLIIIESNQNKLLSLSSGSGRVRISKKNLFEKFNFLLPSLEEQTKIANFLSSIDSKIEQTQKQLDSTKEFKKALLQQMFV